MRDSPNNSCEGDYSRKRSSIFYLKSMVTSMHVSTIICSNKIIIISTKGTTHEQMISICRQLFAGHVVGCWPMKWQEKMHQMKIKNFPLRPAEPSNVLQSFSSFIAVGKGQAIFLLIIISF